MVQLRGDNLPTEIAVQSAMKKNNSNM
jgi:hypothetical protein